MKHLENVERFKHALTSIPEYDVKAADDEDWDRMRMLLNENNWTKTLEYKTVQETTDIVLSTIEETVKKIFKKKINNMDQPDNVSTSSQTCNQVIDGIEQGDENKPKVNKLKFLTKIQKRSNNIIQKKVRIFAHRKSVDQRNFSKQLQQKSILH